MKAPLSLPTCAAAAAAKSLQSCPTLCDPIDGSPPGSPVSGILQHVRLQQKDSQPESRFPPGSEEIEALEN